jgi:hypothetical protein
MTEEERRKLASQATSTLGSNLAMGGFNNPMTYNPPERQSLFAGSAEQFSRMPEQAAAPSNLFTSMVAPTFPENYSQQLGQGRTMDLGAAPSMAPTTDAITSFGSPMSSRTERIDSQYGTASTTLTPEQQTARFQSQQQAQEAGTMPRTPEQQQALLAQMREKGAALGQQRVANMEEFFKQKRAERSELTKATSEAAMAGMSPQSIREARSAYTSQQPSSISGIRQQFNQMVPTFGTPMAERVAPIRQAFNIPAGRPQPSQGMSAFAPTPILDNEDEFGNPFSFSLFRPLLRS